ncbi:phosphopyruvate hydratase [Candidatus Woesearchaeota archaeon]|nr:phosphopyruvate hydratase [Candidatus Woesearchaeota archaeon]
MCLFKIHSVHARQVLDSRGNPTVECEVRIANFSGTAIVPSGASTGVHEAVELRDKGKSYHGKGVQKAVDIINRRISKFLVGMDVTNQIDIDLALMHHDGTKNKSKLGANAILAVSMASARCAANSLNIPLHRHIARLAHNKHLVMPIPFANIINGGAHAGGGLPIQELMIVPEKARSFREATMMVSEVYHELKSIIKRVYGPHAINVGDEGGFVPPIKDLGHALSMMQDAIDRCKYHGRVSLALDCAASEFYNKKNKTYMHMLPRKLMSYYMHAIKHNNIVSIEDPFDQDDIESWKTYLPTARKLVQVIGDDLTCTNPALIGHAVNERLCNTLLLKVNQIGTITEAINAAKQAHRAGWNVMVSHRSGETEDPFIAHLAVGLGCGQIKLGAPARGERTAKYNELLRIEEQARLKYAKIVLPKV